MMPPNGNPLIWDNKVCSEPMQYTGLKDKNGKMIFEGDVVKSEIEQVIGDSISTDGVIEWDDNRGYWKYDLPDYGQSFALAHLLDNEEILEIIGNIYENPELIKV